MSVKINLSKGEFKGNLNDSKQSYSIDFLPRELDGEIVKYPPKVRLMIIAPGKSGGDSLLSLYMANPNDVKELFLNLIMAYGYFKRQKEHYDPLYQQYLLSKEILNPLIEAAKHD